MYTIELTKEEMEGLAGLIDAGLRATGLRAAKMASTLADKLEAAVKLQAAVVGGGIAAKTDASVPNGAKLPAAPRNSHVGGSSPEARQ